MKAALEIFQPAAADPLDYARQWKSETGGPVVGTVCSYAPEEIIHAAGALPVRIFGRPSAIVAADSHLQAYACRLARGILEAGLSGDLDFLDGMVFPHTCDTIARLSDIWRLNLPAVFHSDVVLPVRLDADSSRDYLRAVLDRFENELAQRLGVSIGADALSASWQVFGRIRTALKRIYQARSRQPEILAAGDFHQILMACQVMDRCELADRLEHLADLVDSAEGSGEQDRPRVLVSGGLCHMPDFFTAIETAGADVVGDDLCTGGRYVDGPFLELETTDPMATISAWYAQRHICPAKYSGLNRRADRLVELADRHRADGVILLRLKFCDPHAFDMPYLVQRLDAHGIAHMIYETEDHSAAGAHFVNRCQAFVEML